MFRLVVLPCFDLCTSKSLYINTQPGIGVIDGFITAVHSLMLSLSLLVFQVKLDWLPMPYMALIRPSQLSCLGGNLWSTDHLSPFLGKFS